MSHPKFDQRANSISKNNSGTRVSHPSQNSSCIAELPKGTGVVHHPIVLKDMRAGSFSLENNGFQLVPLHSKMSVSDYSNIETIEKRSFPEVGAAVKEL